MSPWMSRPIAALNLALALALGAAPGAAQAATPAATDWRDEVIYLVMPDRFSNGDRANDHDADPRNAFAYHGGDLKGLEGKLDYLKDLGVTALWLTPVNDNTNGPFVKKYWGYHGYWIQGFDAVDEHLGTEADLKRLVAAAHARGLKVFLDVVVNHAGYDAAIAHDPKKRAWFHHNGSISNWEDPYQNENFDLAGLPDFASENAEVLAFHEKAWGHWITACGIDGFRLDTVRHVARPFWHRFNAAMHTLAKRPFFIVGEVSYHDPARIAPYFTEAGLDGAFDFPMFETLVKVFAKGESPHLLAKRLGEDAVYPTGAVLSPFLDNHDEERFANVAKGDPRKVKLALSCLLTMRGAPSLTWGTEIGLPGGRDPDNRRDMPWRFTADQQALHDHTRRLLALRRALPALRRGSLSVLEADPRIIVYARQFEDQCVLVALNNADEPVTREITLPGGTGWNDGTTLADRLGGEAVQVHSGSITLHLMPKQAQILLPSD